MAGAGAGACAGAGAGAALWTVCVGTAQDDDDDDDDDEEDDDEVHARTPARTLRPTEAAGLALHLPAYPVGQTNDRSRSG